MTRSEIATATAVFNSSMPPMASTTAAMITGLMNIFILLFRSSLNDKICFTTRSKNATNMYSTMATVIAIEAL